jgi:hypothetical protein
VRNPRSFVRVEPDPVSKRTVDLSDTVDVLGRGSGVKK